MDESLTRGGTRPEETQPLKRKSVHEPERQSESPKRARTGREDVRTGDASPGAPTPSPQRTEAPKRSSEDAKRRVSQEERRRGMRLFGGLLGTLSQRPTNPQQQKRQEIEKRQQERLKQQRAEEQKAVREKKAKLEETRTRESINWEERVVRADFQSVLDWISLLTPPHSYTYGTRRCGPRPSSCERMRGPISYSLLHS